MPVESNFRDDWTTDPKRIVEVAETNNKLLYTMLSHPEFNHANPGASPKPLLNAVSFVRKTYMEYVQPLLPLGAELRSSRIANSLLLVYDEETGPCPQEPNDEWLLNPANWPPHRQTNEASELLVDAYSRTSWICLALNDPEKGAMLLQGTFDWENPVDIKALTKATMEKKRKDGHSHAEFLSDDKVKSSNA